MKGVTIPLLKSYPVAVNFNSHAREGRDIVCEICYSPIIYFNSHAREGRDVRVLALKEQKYISTHTPVKGVTTFPEFVRMAKAISTHTPVKGVTIEK